MDDISAAADTPSRTGMLTSIKTSATLSLFDAYISTASAPFAASRISVSGRSVFKNTLRSMRLIGESSTTRTFSSDDAQISLQLPDRLFPRVPDPFPVRFPYRSASRFGRENSNTAPFLAPLSASGARRETSPPSAFASPLDIESPSPAPDVFPAAPPSPRKKGVKSSFFASSSTPGPESQTDTDKFPFFSSGRPENSASTTTRPESVNLIAFETRFDTIRRIFGPSETTTGSSPDAKRYSSFFDSATAEYDTNTSFRRSKRSVSEENTRSTPSSRDDAVRRSSRRDRSDFVPSFAYRVHSFFSSSFASAPSERRSRNPTTPERGVRIS